jgi:two-component system, OmpR family, response regulator CpxR
MAETATNAARLLIIDDDVELCDLLSKYLRKDGFESECVHLGRAGIERVASHPYALVILDVMLPDLNGFDVLKAIRQQRPTPVLMLTARGDEIDRIVGLELGADDYLPKPFNPRELLARIHAILRRIGPGGTEPSDRKPAISIDDITLDPGARTVHRGGQTVALTSTEFDLLEALMRRAGQEAPREELSRAVFGRPLLPDDRSIDMHVSSIRRKLGPGPRGYERIKTLRGTGYIYAFPPHSQGDRSSSAP